LETDAHGGSLAGFPICSIKNEQKKFPPEGHPFTTTGTPHSSGSADAGCSALPDESYVSSRFKPLPDGSVKMKPPGMTADLICRFTGIRHFLGFNPVEHNRA
jgi:hypothetical protein